MYLLTKKINDRGRGSHIPESYHNNLINSSLFLVVAPPAAWLPAARQDAPPGLADITVSLSLSLSLADITGCRRFYLRREIHTLHWTGSTEDECKIQTALIEILTVRRERDKILVSWELLLRLSRQTPSSLFMSRSSLFYSSILFLFVKYF